MRLTLAFIACNPGKCASVAEIINLRRMRKRRERQAADADAAAARRGHGRNKAEREAETQVRAARERQLDNAFLGGSAGDGEPLE